MIEIIKGMLMMAAAVIGMLLLVAGISLAVCSPFILVVWLIIKAFA